MVNKFITPREFADDVILACRKAAEEEGIDVNELFMALASGLGCAVNERTEQE